MSTASFQMKWRMTFSRMKMMMIFGTTDSLLGFKIFKCKRVKERAGVITLALGHLRYRHKAYEDSLLFHSSDLYKESNRTGACEDDHDTWCFCI